MLPSMQYAVKKHVAKAVLNAETSLMEEYCQLYKGKDKTI